MPNRIVYNEQASQLKTQIYGTDGTTPAQVFTDGAVSVSGQVALPDGTAVEISGVPSISIAGVSILDNALKVTFDQKISVTIEGTPTVNIGNMPTVLFDRPVQVTGTVKLSNDSKVGISGVVTASITGVPSVSITGCVCVSVNGIVPVKCIEDDDPRKVSIVGRGTVSSITSYFIKNANTNYLWQTSGEDISQLGRFGYFVEAPIKVSIDGGGDEDYKTSKLSTVDIQYAPINANKYFIGVNAPYTILNPGMNIVPQEPPVYGYFARLSLTLQSTTNNVTVTVYFQGQN